MTSLAVRYRLTGKTLRWVVCIVLLDAKKALTVAEIVAAVEARGFEIPGARAGKSVSDALRWEVGRGRAVQLRRGLYGSGSVQRSTEYSMRKRVDLLKQALPASLVATTAANSAPAGGVEAVGGGVEAVGGGVEAVGGGFGGGRVSLVATTAADSTHETFDLLDAAMAQAAAEERELAMLRARAGASAFAAIVIDDLVTPADDVE